jgi:hypothetical protein
LYGVQAFTGEIEPYVAAGGVEGSSGKRVIGLAPSPATGAPIRVDQTQCSGRRTGLNSQIEFHLVLEFIFTSLSELVTKAGDAATPNEGEGGQIERRVWPRHCALAKLTGLLRQCCSLGAPHTKVFYLPFTHLICYGRPSGALHGLRAILDVFEIQVLLFDTRV